MITDTQQGDGQRERGIFFSYKFFSQQGFLVLCCKLASLVRCSGARPVDIDTNQCSS